MKLPVSCWRLKNTLARADQIPTLIFDEIDQGIGGRVGAVVGQKLWNLGRAHQVMVITHLPQLAAFGDQHFQVQKLIQDGRTITQVKGLDGDERTLELAQMLGEVSEGTLRSAHEILQIGTCSPKEEINCKAGSLCGVERLRFFMKWEHLEVIMIRIYRHDIEVPPSAIDENGHVNNVQYVQWMQDAAVQHSNAAGCTQVTLALGATWVIRSHQIEYLRPAFQGDHLVVLTWVSNFRKVRSLRKYRFFREFGQGHPCQRRNGLGAGQFHQRASARHPGASCRSI